MLVDPVRPQPGHHPAAPPRRPGHLLAPGLGGVPVVAQVVVVEDHRGRHGGQQPADLGLGPRLAVELGVLLEVGDLALRLGVPAGADVGQHVGRGVVGVDLVAEEQQQVGPLLLGRLGEVLAEGPQHVVTVGTHVRRVVGHAGAARSERQLAHPFPGQQPDPGRRATRHRPNLLPVELHRVRRDILGQLDEIDDRVVVTVHSEGRRPVSPASRLDGDCAGLGGLHPDRRAVEGDVPQHRPHHQCGQWKNLLVRRSFTLSCASLPEWRCPPHPINGLDFYQNSARSNAPL